MFVFYPLPTRNTDRLRDSILKNAFSIEECNNIKSLAGEMQLAKPSGELYEGGDTSYSKNFFSKRIINNEETEWLFKKLAEYTEYINRTYYNFFVEEIRETYIVKFQRGSFFPSHVDIGKSIVTSGRKFSYWIDLSTQEEYEGALIKLKYQNPITDSNFGDITIIPSFMPYEITELLAGEKYFLLSYAYGPHYR